MTETPIPDLKADLELQKLKLEIRILKRPWWRTPGYVLAVLPLVIAAVSISLAWGTGLIDAKSINLDTKRARLEMEVRGFEERKDALNTANDQLTRMNQRLLAEKREIENARAQAATDLAALRVDRHLLTRKLAELEMERQSLLNVRAKLQHDLDTEKVAAADAIRNLALQPVTAFIVSLPDSVGNELGREAQTVIAALATDAGRRPLYLQALGTYLSRPDISNNRRARVLQVVALGTGDEAMKRQLRDAVASAIDKCQANTQTVPELNLLVDRDARRAGVGWTVADRIAILEMLSGRLFSNNVNSFVRYEMVDLADDLTRTGEPLMLHRSRPAIFLNLVRAARGLIAEERQHASLGESPCLRFLRTNAPPAFLVVASEIFTGAVHGRPYHVTVIENTARSLQFVRAVKPGMESSEFDLQQPDGDRSKSWVQWRAKYAPLVSLWESDLSSLAADHDLLIRAAEDGAFE